MVSSILQLISDEIICHKKAIDDIEEKLNFLKFINEVDNYMDRTFNLNKEDLLLKRSDLENKLKKLLEQKSELMSKQEINKELKHSSNSIQNSFRMSNYLSMHNFESMEVEIDLNPHSNQ